MPGHEDRTVVLETGSFSVAELEAAFAALPVDISFVDKDDTVRYFNPTPGRIFARTKAVVGRKVQNCHPAKSVHVVQRILDDFRAGKRNQEQFWIDLHGKFVHIRYVAVRGPGGEYLGCLEVSQDIAPLREIRGEKRLLDD